MNFCCKGKDKCGSAWHGRVLIGFLNGRNMGIFKAVGYHSLEMDTLLLM